MIWQVVSWSRLGMIVVKLRGGYEPRSSGNENDHYHHGFVKPSTQWDDLLQVFEAPKTARPQLSCQSFMPFSSLIAPWLRILDLILKQVGWGCGCGSKHGARLDEQKLRSNIHWSSHTSIRFCLPCYMAPPSFVDLSFLIPIILC